MDKKNITEEEFSEFKKDMFELIKMHGEKIDKVLKKDPSPTSPIPNPNPEPNMPEIALGNPFCSSKVFIVSKSPPPSPEEENRIKGQITAEVVSIMKKYKVSELEAHLLYVHP